MCKVSVLVPVYNVEKYLSQCLDSIVNQSLVDIEIICINDGSTDKSREILNQYAKKDKRIIVIDKENTGYGHSMNLGLKTAKGEYIGIVESDDFAEHDMFEVLSEIADINHADVVKSNFFSHFSSHDMFNEYLKAENYGDVCNFSQIKSQNPFRLATEIWSGIYRRDFLEDNNINFLETPGASYQDTSFGMKIFMCMRSIVFCKQAFIHYRIDNEGSSVHSFGKVFCACDEYGELWRFIEEKGDIQESMRFFLASEQFFRYIGVYGRIADQFKEAFLLRMIKEYDELSQKNLIREEYWDSDSWRDVKKMLNSPERILAENLLTIQMHRMYYEAFIDETDSKDNIYIYGAGLVGRRVLNLVRKCDLKISSFLVTSLAGNDYEFDGIPITTFSSEIVDRCNNLILIAIGEKSQYEIVKLLQKQGFNNYIIMSGPLQQALRQRIYDTTCNGKEI